FRQKTRVAAFSRHYCGKRWALRGCADECYRAPVACDNRSPVETVAGRHDLRLCSINRNFYDVAAVYVVRIRSGVSCEDQEAFVRRELYVLGHVVAGCEKKRLSAVL